MTEMNTNRHYVIFPRAPGFPYYPWKPTNMNSFRDNQ